MTKKYRSKKSTTKKYKKKRGGRDSEYGKDSESDQNLRGPVGDYDKYIAKDVSKKFAEDKCDEAIEQYNKFFSQGKVGDVAFPAFTEMKNACKSQCVNVNKQKCPSLKIDDPYFFINLHSKSDDPNYDIEQSAYVRNHSEIQDKPPDNNNSTTVLNNLINMDLTDKMFILPCLQEREQLNEMEQRGSIIRDEVQTAIPQGNAIYYQFWHGKKEKNFKEELDDQRKSIDVPPLLKNRTPNKTSVLGYLPTCRKYTTDQKWQMYGEWAEANFKKEEEEEAIRKKDQPDTAEEEDKKNEEPKKPKGRTVLLITHHNRLRGLGGMFDFEQGLLPIKNNKQCDSYANNFCFRIHYDPNASSNKITTEIAFQGFPDKGEFGISCKNKIGCNKKTGGGENYTYCCPTKDVTNIDTALLEKGLYNSGITKPTTFYVIRHGNAIHNKPMKIKDGRQLDSPLTPLGLYQAKTLGCFLKQNKDYKEDFNGQVILGTSLLSRTQLTGLAILNEIQDGGLNKFKNENLLDDYKLLKQVSLKKFTNIADDNIADDKYSTFTNLAIFNQFQPVTNNIRERNNENDFYQYCCTKLNLDKYIPPKKYECLKRGGKKKKQTRKIRRKKK